MFSTQGSNVVTHPMQELNPGLMTDRPN